MKKIFVVFALFCVFFLVSCGDSTNDNKNSNSNETENNSMKVLKMPGTCILQVLPLTTSGKMGLRLSGV